ncbi:hypothetical protein [Aquimarina rhabdastrellae]
MSGKRPEKCISVEEAKELQQQWCDHRAHHLHKCLGHEDAREFWWSVEELEEYLAYVKEESTKQGIKNPGIRMYMGAYPQQKCSHGKGMSTLFLTPTGSKVRSLGKDGGSEPNNYNIQPLNGGSSGNPPADY